MFLSKSITLAFLASSVNVGAFTTPNASLLELRHARLAGLSTAGLTQDHPPVLVVQHSTFDQSLKFWKKDSEDVQEQETSNALTDQSANTVNIDNGRADFIAPGIYALFTSLLIYIIYGLSDAVTTKTLGSTALALVTGALIWDNLIITIGSIFFKDAETNPLQNKILQTISWPRFTLHAVAVPFQCITIAEIGKAAGLEFLQSDLLQTGLVAVACVVAIADRTTFVQSPGITLETWEDSPFYALERDLVKFTYKEGFNIAYLLPVIVLVLFNLVVGIGIMNTGENPDLAKWMLFAAGTSLAGNAIRGPVGTFSGNLGEVGMQYGLLQAATIVYGGGM